MKKTQSEQNPLIAMLRRFRLSSTLSAIVYLILGIVLVVMPNTSRAVLGSVIGIGVTLYGVLSILSFLLSGDQTAYVFELLIGVCAAAFGVFSLLNPTFLLNFLFIVLGLVGIIGSISGIKRALSLRQMGYPRWAVPLVPNIVTLIIAVSVTFSPGLYGNLATMVVGVMLIVEAVSDLFSLYRLSKLTKAL